MCILGGVLRRAQKWPCGNPAGRIRWRTSDEQFFFFSGVFSGLSVRSARVLRCIWTLLWFVYDVRQSASSELLCWLIHALPSPWDAFYNFACVMCCPPCVAAILLRRCSDPSVMWDWKWVLFFLRNQIKELRPSLFVFSSCVHLVSSWWGEQFGCFPSCSRRLVVLVFISHWAVIAEFSVNFQQDGKPNTKKNSNKKKSAHLDGLSLHQTRS